MAQASSFYGVGLATLTTGGRVLDVWYPQPQEAEDGLQSSGVSDLAEVSSLRTGEPGTIQLPNEAAEKVLGLPMNAAIGYDELRQVERVAVLNVISSLDDPPVDAYDAYLRLHLLSHRRVAPHQPNLEGLFGLLSNVVWTSLGPCPVDDFESVRLRARANGQSVQVHSLDKFPRMTDYVIPSGVRIADADRVRLGAHLAEGTTVMHEGFVNFNAGTLGASMVEGRISAGVVVDDGSDIGGGASIMGTLSGGGKEVIRVGKRCLVGANGGIGISLGDDCVVEAGLYITAGTRISLPDGRTVKGAELTGRSGLLYRRNSTTGAVEALTRSPDAGVSLNTELHSHN